MKAQGDLSVRTLSSIPGAVPATQADEYRQAAQDLLDYRAKTRWLTDRRRRLRPAWIATPLRDPLAWGTTYPIASQALRNATATSDVVSVIGAALLPYSLVFTLALGLAMALARCVRRPRRPGWALPWRLGVVLISLIIGIALVLILLHVGDVRAAALIAGLRAVSGLLSMPGSYPRKAPAPSVPRSG